MFVRREAPKRDAMLRWTVGQDVAYTTPGVDQRFGTPAVDLLPERVDGGFNDVGADLEVKVPDVFDDS